MLTAAGEAYDRMKQAQAVIKKAGMTVVDRHGQLKAHPCCLIEQANRAQLLTAIKSLGLDIEPLQPRAGRPAGSRTLRAV